MKELLSEIKSFYAAHSPVCLTRKTVPATAREIAAFEAEFGEKFPEDFRRFLLLNDVAYPFVFNYECFDFELAKQVWSSMNELLDEGAFDDGRIERHLKEEFGNWDDDYLTLCWWHKKWFPFAQDSRGNMYCLDFAPGARGKKHQILNIEIQDGGGPFLYLRDGFTAFLSNHLQYLKKGQYLVLEHGIEVDAYLKPKKGGHRISNL